MDLRSVKQMMSTVFMFAILAMAIGSFIGGSAMVVVMKGFFAVFIITYVFFWKCPKCKKHIGKMSALKCKHCGHDIYSQNN